MKNNKRHFFNRMLENNAYRYSPNWYVDQLVILMEKYTIIKFETIECKKDVISDVLRYNDKF